METSFASTPALSPVAMTGEASHRIANQLSTLAILVEKQKNDLCEGSELIPRDVVVAALAGVSMKLRAIATLHKKLMAQPDEDELDLNAALVDILHGFRAIFGDRVRMNTSTGEGYRLKSSRLSMLALAFAEIVTNAIKYAHPTGLPVEFTISSRRTCEGGMVLTVSDDGVGLPEGFDVRCGGSAGLRLVQALVTSAGGQLRTFSSELGLAFEIDLPGPNGRAETSDGGQVW